MHIQRIVRTGVIAAVYVALCLLLAPLSFGVVQVRFAEALTLLPVFCPEAVIGVSLGCFLANFFASSPLDMVVGTAATLLAALATRALRNVRVKGLPLLAALPPVLFNALIVGAELTFLAYPTAAAAGGVPAAVWLANMGSVGAGQLVSCCGLGLLLVWAVGRQPALQKALGAPARQAPPRGRRVQ